jgi:hypothetical protein
MTSSFECDGYQDGLDGREPYPPYALFEGTEVFADEYLRGYEAGKKERERLLVEG